MKKKRCFSMVPHIIHPSFLHNKDGGLVGGCCWFTLAILVTIWFRVFCKPLLLLCFPWVELVGARKETKLFGKNLEQQHQQQQDIHKSFIDTKVECMRGWSGKRKITKHVSYDMEICWGSRVALDQLLIGSHTGEREREREREKTWQYLVNGNNLFTLWVDSRFRV
jgi:hypothetical protein